MKLALIQENFQAGQTRANLKIAEKAINSLPENTDMVCLPEMFYTGFDYAAIKKSACSLNDNQALRQLTECAKKRNFWLLSGSWPESEGREVYNTSVLSNEKGEFVGVYRKIHLFPLGPNPELTEERHLSAGQSITVAPSKWGKIGLAICYDLRFPELFRHLMAAGARLILAPAQFGASRQNHWQTLIKARAIENMVFLVGINRTGKDESGRFVGGSAVIDPWGEVLAMRGNEPGVVLAELDLTKSRQARQKLPAVDHMRGDLFPINTKLF